MAAPSWVRQQQQDDLLRLQIEKLQREKRGEARDQFAQSSKRELEGIAVVTFALLRFIFKHPIISAIVAGCAYCAFYKLDYADWQQFNRTISALYENLV
jgi:hypothetical protein